MITINLLQAKVTILLTLGRPGHPSGGRIGDSGGKLSYGDFVLRIKGFIFA